MNDYLKDMLAGSKRGISPNGPSAGNAPTDPIADTPAQPNEAQPKAHADNANAEKAQKNSPSSDTRLSPALSEETRCQNEDTSEFDDDITPPLVADDENDARENVANENNARVDIAGIEITDVYDGALDNALDNSAHDNEADTMHDGYDASETPADERDTEADTTQGEDTADEKRAQAAYPRDIKAHEETADDIPKDEYNECGYETIEEQAREDNAGEDNADADNGVCDINEGGYRAADDDDSEMPAGGSVRAYKAPAKLDSNARISISSDGGIISEKDLEDAISGAEDKNVERYDYNKAKTLDEEFEIGKRAFDEITASGPHYTAFREKKARGEKIEQETGVKDAYSDYDAYRAPYFKWFAIIMGLIVAICAGGLIYSHIASDKGPYVTEVEEVPPSVEADFEKDVKSPGMHEYEALGSTYVLLTFGETSGIDMTVDPDVSGNSVYFNIGSEKVSEQDVRCVYRLYRTNAGEISADENKLKAPGYGVGSEGVNIGFVKESGDNEYYITPVLDTTPTDRVFMTSGEARLGTGIYRYGYMIDSTGAKVTSCKALSNYECYAYIDKVDAEDHTVDLLFGDDKVRLTADASSLSQAEAESIASLAGEDTLASVKLACRDGEAAVISVAQFGGVSMGAYTEGGDK